MQRNTVRWLQITYAALSMVDDVKTYLAANSITGRIVAGHMPDAMMEGVGVFDTGGLPPNSDYPVDDFTFQVRVRGRAKNYTATLAKANAIHVLLNRKINFTIGTLDVMRCQAIQKPFPMPLDSKGRWEVYCNYVCKIRDPHNEE